MLGHGRGIGCVMVHVVASIHLRGATVTTPVMRDDAIAIGKEEQHLRIPVIRRQRPAVMEGDRLRVFWAPILVENLGAVLRNDRVHGAGSFPGAVTGLWSVLGTGVRLDWQSRANGHAGCSDQYTSP